MAPRWSSVPNPRPMPRGYFRAKLAGLLSDMAGGVVQAGIAATPPRPDIGLPTRAPAPPPVVPVPGLGGPAVGFGGGGVPGQATAPETTTTFQTASPLIASLTPAINIAPAGAHSRAEITNLGPGPCWLGPSSSITAGTGDFVLPGETVDYGSSAGVWAIASPAQPAQLQVVLET